MICAKCMVWLRWNLYSVYFAAFEYITPNFRTLPPWENWRSYWIRGFRSSYFATCTKRLVEHGIHECCHIADVHPAVTTYRDRLLEHETYIKDVHHEIYYTWTSKIKSLNKYDISSQTQNLVFKSSISLLYYIKLIHSFIN